MKRIFRQECLVLLCVLFSSSMVWAQAITGTPAFGSLQGSPDIVNLGNLNVHMAYPVLHKAGRGLPLNYDLSSDTSIWQPVNSGNSTTWTPVQALGWSGSPQGVGFLGFDYVTDGQTFITYSYFQYLDSSGTWHPFNGTASWYSCCGDSPLVDSISTDGSGYTLSADACVVVNDECTLGITLTSADGSYIYPQNGIPFNPTITAGSVVDRNGNEITTDGYGNVTDTLGLQNGLKTLRVSGGNPNPYVLAYTSPAGTDADVSVTFKSYQVRTNFGCSGVGEYGGSGGTTLSLVDRITLPDLTYYQFTYETTPGDTHTPHHVTSRIATMTLPTGGTISYDYSVGTHNGIECADGSTSGVKRTTPDGAWIYTRTLGTGTASTTTIEDPKSNYTVIQFQGIYETQRSTYQGSVAPANLLQTVNTCYNGAATPCTGTAITLPVLSRTVTTQLGTATSNVQAKQIYSYTKYGFTTEEDDYDWGPGAPGALLKKTIITPNTSLGAIQSLPASVTIEDGSGKIWSSVAMSYDQSCTTTTSGTPQHATIPCTTPRGNLTTLAVTANSSTTLYRTFTYYDTGNPNTSTAVSTSSTTHGATTTYNYASGTASCGNSFATSFTEPLSLSRSMTWNCIGGVQLSATDENGAPTSAAYTDSYFWRPSSTTDAYPSTTDLTYPSANIAESTLTFNSGNSTTDIRVTLDSLGRQELTQKKQSPTSTTYDTTESVYDVSGQLEHATLPFPASAGGTNPTAPGTTTTYDALNRQMQTSDSGGGTVSYTYSKNDVLVTTGPAPSGENTKRRQLEYDGLGRLSSVCELTTVTGSGTCAQSTTQTGFWTKYTYDPNGNRASVTQNAQATTGQQTRTYVYDEVGRLTSEANPETGTKTYTYDTDATCGSSTSQAGQLVKRVDALSNVTCYTYDALNRNTGITYPSGPYAANTPSKTFVYDASSFSCPTGQANLKTRLAEAYTGPSTAKITDIGYCYSPRGETSEVFESTPHSAGMYGVPMTYWENGLTKTFGPFLTEAQVSVTPDGEGRALTISGGASNIAYNSASQPTQLMTSCGSTCYPINYTYDPNTLRMTQYAAALSSGTTSGTLTWNPNGSLQQLVVVDPKNSANAQTCTYGADDLGRIASNSCTSTPAWSQTFSYDPFGNISKSGSTSWLPGYNTSNQYTLNGTSYDANGNLLNDSFNKYTWDAEGKPLSTAYSEGSGETWTYVYDAFGHKVEFSANGTYENSFLNIGKWRLEATGQIAGYSETPLPGGSVASQNSGDTGLQLADWLGTIRTFYSYTGGNQGQSLAHAPFGESYANANGGYPLAFTGQLNDGTMGNTTYFFPERQYRSNQGRWLSPDPSGVAAVDPTDPQSWNRYAYVRNSPLNRIDPLGLDDGGCDPDSGDCGGDPGPCGDWGCDGGGGGGVLVTINWGPRGVNVGLTGFGGCQGESLGLPCGMNITDPNAQLARQALIAAIKGNWKGLLGTLGEQGWQSAMNIADNPVFDAKGGWWDVGKLLQEIGEKVHSFFDKAECAIDAAICGDAVNSNNIGDNVNQDPMKLLYDAEACQQQAQQSGRPDLCSTASYNNVTRSGIGNEACKKAYECALGLTTPQ